MVDVQDLALNYFDYLSRSDIAGLYHNTILNFLINCHTLSYQYFIFHILTNSCYFYSFFIITILMSVNGILVVLIFISLMISDAEHLFTCLLAINISYLKKCPFKCFVLSFASLWISFRSSLYILDINHLSYIWFINIFSPTQPFHSIDIFNFLININLSIFFFFATHVFGVISKLMPFHFKLWDFL